MLLVVLVSSRLKICHGVSSEVPDIDTVAAELSPLKSPIEQPDANAYQHSDRAVSNLTPDSTAGDALNKEVSGATFGNRIEPIDRDALGKRVETVRKDAAPEERHDEAAYVCEVVDPHSPGKSSVTTTNSQDKLCVTNARETGRSGMKDMLDENFQFEAAQISEQDRLMLKRKKRIGSKLRHISDSNKQKLRRLQPPAFESIDNPSIKANPEPPPASASYQTSTQKQEYITLDHNEERVQETPVNPVWLQPSVVPTYHVPTPVDYMTAQVGGPVALLPVYKLEDPVFHRHWPNGWHESWAYTSSWVNPIHPLVHTPTSNEACLAQVTEHTPFFQATQTQPCEYAHVAGHFRPATEGLPDFGPARSTVYE